MPGRRPSRRTARRALGVLAAQLLLAAGLRVAVLQPERCPPPSAAATDAAIEASLAWFATNQLPDGRWRYRYDAEGRIDLGGYNVVRHAGVLLALEQASAAGHPAAGPLADRGWAHLEGLLVDPGDGSLAVDDGSLVFDTGAVALAAAAWTYRLDRLGAGGESDGPARPDGPDGVDGPAGVGRLVRLGRFLVGQLDADGAVAAFRDRDGSLWPERSRFSTGEAAWALRRLAVAAPGAGFEEPAERTVRYVSTRRDAAERWFPAIADHWAAYALAEPAVGGGGPTEAQRADAARTLAGRFAVQVRWESQRRPGRAWSDLTRARPATGAAIGTLGEGLGRLADAAPPGAWRDGLRRQQACAAGLLVQRQWRATDPDPAAAGAWVAGGVTQMDDQQHALSALLAYRSSLGEPPAGGAATGSEGTPPR